jgi:hypothetical protein
LSEAFSIIHRYLLFKRWPIMGSKLWHERGFAHAPIGIQASSQRHGRTRESAAER